MADAETNRPEQEQAADAETPHKGHPTEAARSEPPEEQEEEPEEEPLFTPGMDWFVLRVASNKEDQVRQTLLRKVKIEGMTDRVNRILVPRRR